MSDSREHKESIFQVDGISIRARALRMNKYDIVYKVGLSCIYFPFDEHKQKIFSSEN